MTQRPASLLWSSYKTLATEVEIHDAAANALVTLTRVLRLTMYRISPCWPYAASKQVTLFPLEVESTSVPRVSSVGPYSFSLVSPANAVRTSVSNVCFPKGKQPSPSRNSPLIG